MKWFKKPQIDLWAFIRNGSVSRKTKETGIEAGVDLDGTGVAKIATGIGFFE